jgi:MFS family permease
LWGGETIEWFTDQISTLALPTIAIFVFHAGPVETGVLRALDYVAFPFLGLYAGVMVDRWRRKPVLVWTNIIQVVALASIPAAFLLGRLSLLQVFLVALVMGITSVFFAVAYQAYLPTLIGRDDLVEGNSKLETSSSAANVGGPTIAGALYQLFGPVSVVVDAIGTLVAAFMILSIRKVELPPPVTVERHFWPELRVGVRTVAGSATLRNLAASTSVLNFGTGMFMAVFYLFIYERLAIAPGLAGVVLGIGSLGFIVGAISSPRLLKRLGLGAVLTLALLLNGLGLLAVQASIFGPASVMLSVLWLLANIGLPIYNINQVSLRQTIVPDILQGRMNATMRASGYGAVAIGALVGGVVGSRYGILSAMTIGALISLIPVFIIQFGPVGRLREMPKIEQ